MTVPLPLVSTRSEPLGDKVTVKVSVPVLLIASCAETVMTLTPCDNGMPAIDQFVVPAGVAAAAAIAAPADAR